MCIIVLTVRNIAHTENLSGIVYTFSGKKVTDVHNGTDCAQYCAH